jgi:hypothetical protein
MKAFFQVSLYELVPVPPERRLLSTATYVQRLPEIDLTARIYIEDLVLELPEGVTLAGNRGHNGSKGAILTSDSLKTPHMIRVTGRGARVTGLRLQGPNTKRYIEHHSRSYGTGGLGAQYYYKLPTSNGIECEADRLEVDNCEILGFSHGGVWLPGGEGHHLHHCYIHHCQYQGLGYGVVLNTASVKIEMNLFNHNWFPLHLTRQSAVHAHERTKVFNNAHGAEAPKVIE